METSETFLRVTKDPSRLLEKKLSSVFGESLRKNKASEVSATFFCYAEYLSTRSLPRFPDQIKDGQEAHFRPRASNEKSFGVDKRMK